MARSRIPFYFIYFLMITNFSCDYQLDKEYFKEVDKPDLNSIFIDLNEKNDTIAIFQSSQFKYKAEIGSKKIYKIVVYFDNKEITSFNSAEANFYLSSQNYKDGFYIMRLEMYTSSGTGSLGDKLGAEQIKFVREWIASIDRTIPQPVSITSIKQTNGTLEIKWERYTQHNFQAYVLRKYCFDPYFGVYLSCEQYEIKSKSQTNFNDLNFMGGIVRYELSVIGGGQPSSVTQKDFSFAFDPMLKHMWIDKKNVKLTWRKTPFFKNFQKYDLVVSGSPIDQFSITSINDTSIIFEPKIKFGSERSAIIKHFAQKEYTGMPQSIDNIGIGEKMPPFYQNNIIFNGDLNKYFIVQYVKDSDYKLVRVNGTTLAAEQELPVKLGAIAISENGEYFYLSSENSLKRLDPLTFQVIENFNDAGVVTSVSNNNLVSVAKFGASQLLKMPESSILKSWANPRIKVSPSGKLLFSENQLFEWDGISFRPKGTLGTLDGLFYVLFQGDEKVIIVLYNSIKVLNVSTMQIENTILKNDFNSQTVVYDSYSRLVGRFEPTESNQSGTYYLYDLNVSSPIRTFEIGFNDISYGIYHTLINNNLICSNGYILPLSFFYP
jgi:hypothetical protein